MSLIDILGGGGGGVSGGDEPEVTNISPTPDTTISTNQALSFDITDDTGLVRVFLAIRIPSLDLYEVVHDGDSFSELYSEEPNDRTAITGGYSFTVLRRGGWPAADITLVPIAIDTGGQENP